MSRSAWMCVLLVCEVTRRFSGILGQCTNHTRPRVMKASPNTRTPILGFQRSASVCEWKIMADEGYVIQVTVPTPNAPAEPNGPCNLTDLHFFDGESPHSPLLKGVCDFGGNLKVTSRGQVMLVQLPPTALADKESGQRWTHFAYTAYPCESPLVYFRPCKTPTLAGRDTATTMSKQLTTTTTTNITTTTNSTHNVGFIIQMTFGAVIFLTVLAAFLGAFCYSCQCCQRSREFFKRIGSCCRRMTERERERWKERQRERECGRGRDGWKERQRERVWERERRIERQRERERKREGERRREGETGRESCPGHRLSLNLNQLRGEFSTGTFHYCVTCGNIHPGGSGVGPTSGTVNQPSTGVTVNARSLLVNSPSVAVIHISGRQRRRARQRENRRERQLKRELARPSELEPEPTTGDSGAVNQPSSGVSGSGGGEITSVGVPVTPHSLFLRTPSAAAFSRTLAERAFVNEGLLSSDQDQARTLRGSLSASTEDGQSGVESAEPPRRLQQVVSPPPPYSSLEVAEMDVHAQVQDERPPPPYTEAMKTAYPPV